MKYSQIVDGSISSTKKAEKSPDKDTTIVSIDAKGKSDERRKSKFEFPVTVAQRMTRDGRNTFRVRQDRTGSIYDPKKSKTDRSYTLVAIDRITRQLRFTMRQCSQQRYNKYLEYLKDGHNALLKQAQREE
jgi:hypothetical protein